MNAYLNDVFATEGKDAEEFISGLKKIDERTNFHKINSSEIQILSWDPKLSDKSDYLGFYLIDPKQMGRFMDQDDPYVPEVIFMNKDKLVDNGMTPEMLKELLSATHMMLRTPAGDFFTSCQTAIGTLASRTMLGGDEFFNPDIVRDMMLAKKLAKLSKPVTLMSRFDGETQKCFAVHSGTYTPIKQSILGDVIERLRPELGKPKVDKWMIDNFLSSIVLTFPEKAEEIADMYELPEKFVPGLYLGTSDTGESSITAMGCWVHNGVISYDAPFKKKHQGDTSSENILKNIEEKIFAKYTKVPETLEKLLGLDIPIEKLPDVYKAIIEESGLKKALGKKLSKTLQEELIDEVFTSAKYTAYNVAVTFMDIPQRLICSSGFTASVKLAIEQAALKAVFCNYERVIKNAAPTLYLGA